MRDELQAVFNDLRSMAAADVPALIGELAHLQACAQMRLIGPMPDAAIMQRNAAPSEFFSIDDLAARWRVSRGTVYNRLRAAGAFSLDFTSKKQSRSKRAIARAVVVGIEEKFTKRVA